MPSGVPTSQSKHFLRASGFKVNVCIGSKTSTGDSQMYWYNIQTQSDWRECLHVYVGCQFGAMLTIMMTLIKGTVAEV